MKREVTQDEITKSKDILANNLYQLLKNDQGIVDCDDNQCDDEDCVVYKALSQYMKYSFNEENNEGVSFEFNKNKK